MRKLCLLFVVLMVGSSVAAKEMGKVLEIQGVKEEVKNRRAGKVSRLNIKDELELHDVVVTGQSSTAGLEISEEAKKGKVYFLVYENSEFKIEPVVVKNGKRNIVARLSSGLIRYLTDGLEAEETVTIETPKVTIGIRGSEGEVLVIPPQQEINDKFSLEVQVIRGEARVFDVKGNITGEPLIVPAGMKVSWVEGEKPKIQPAAPVSHVASGHATVGKFDIKASTEDIELTRINLVAKDANSRASTGGGRNKRYCEALAAGVCTIGCQFASSPPTAASFEWDDGPIGPIICGGERYSF